MNYYKVSTVIIWFSLSVIIAQNPFLSIIEIGLSRIIADESHGVIKTDVSFFLYNKENLNVPLKLTTEIQKPINITNTSFKLIIHGYTDNANKSWILNMKNEYLKKGNYNIIAVDWSQPALSFYPLSATFTNPVGKYISKLLIYLNKTFNIPYENFHLIGHSLGAHAAGFAGKYLKHKGVKVGRITGMDPAGPMFVDNDKNGRLSKEDATFVDVIHTDGYKNGYFDSLGDVDFYPNGGIAIQPGCWNQNNFIELVSCSHLRSYIYFTESINSNNFIAKHCGSYSEYINGICLNNTHAIMGENVDSSIRGLYFLTTNEKQPFARNGRI